MAIEKKSIDYAKEAGDIMDLSVAVIAHFKAGKSVSDAAELLDELMVAIAGSDQIDDEWEANREAVFNAVALGSVKIAGALMKKADAPLA